MGTGETGRRLKHWRCAQHEPNDWVAYVDANTGELLEVARFYNPSRPLKRRDPPPGGWDVGKPF